MLAFPTSPGHQGWLHTGPCSWVQVDAGRAVDLHQSWRSLSLRQPYFQRARWASLLFVQRETLPWPSRGLAANTTLKTGLRKEQSGPCILGIPRRGHPSQQLSWMNLGWDFPDSQSPPGQPAWPRVSWLWVCDVHILSPQPSKSTTLTPDLICTSPWLLKLVGPRHCRAPCQALCVPYFIESSHLLKKCDPSLSIIDR